MRRREFITLLGAAGAWPLAATAQQKSVPLIGWLHGGYPFPPQVNTFRSLLKAQGLVEGDNFAIEYRWGNIQGSRLPDLAADLVRQRPALILALGTIPAVFAAKNATSSIPIVFEFPGDPVKAGVVASFNRPGGNITGVVTLTAEILGKRLDLLKKFAPQIKTVGYLTAPGSPMSRDVTNDVVAAARSLELRAVVAGANGPRDFATAFAKFASQDAEALLVGPYTTFLSNSKSLIELAALHKLPACYSNRGWVLGGGLMSYGPEPVGIHSLMVSYVTRILKGDSPADLPVQIPTKFELVINLKTARTLGLEVPPMLRAIADEVIE